MSRPANPSCSIFVGNVPYDAQEDELRELFSKAGDCTSVRLVHDKDTRQPKGYAFADFADPSTVGPAIEKLNNIEYNGRRLRVDWAERELHHTMGKGAEGPPRGGPGPPGPLGAPGGFNPVAILPPVTTVADRLARIREQEAAEHARQAALEHAELAELARYVETMTPQQLFHIIGEMQRLAMSAPEVARALVAENIQLCLALQHAQYLVGLVEEPPLPTDPEVRERAKSVREKVFGAVSPSEGILNLSSPLTQQAAALNPQVAASLLTLAGASPAGFPGLGQLGAFAAAFASTAPAPSPAPAPPPVGPTSLPPELAGGAPGALLEKLVHLTPAQIDQLPHQTKVQLLGFLQTLPAKAS
jgi:cleavage stimulation factor subunit 2